MAEKAQYIAVRGDITKDHGVQAIVNAVNTSLLGGGVDDTTLRAYESRIKHWTVQTKDINGES